MKDSARVEGAPSKSPYRHKTPKMKSKKKTPCTSFRFHEGQVRCANRRNKVVVPNACREEKNAKKIIRTKVTAALAVRMAVPLRR